MERCVECGKEGEDDTLERYDGEVMCVDCKAAQVELDRDERKECEFTRRLGGYYWSQ